MPARRRRSIARPAEQQKRGPRGYDLEGRKEISLWFYTSSGLWWLETGVSSRRRSVCPGSLPSEVGPPVSSEQGQRQGDAPTR